MYEPNTSRRELIYFLSIDFEKAFDKVNRTILLQKMRSRGHSENIIYALSHILSQTTQHYSQEGLTYATTRGCSQGAVTSPLLWCIYCDSILHQLHPIQATNSPSHAADYHQMEHFSDTRNLHTCLFADDLAAIGSETNIKSAIRILKQWSIDHEIPINLRKSALLQIRQDDRTHTRHAQLEGIDIK